MTRFNPMAVLIAGTLGLYAAAIPFPSAAAEPCAVDDDAMYSPPHLVELAQGLAKIQAAALKNIVRDKNDPDPIKEGQKVTTKAGVLMLYSVHAVDEPGKPMQFLHVMSFSNRGCYLATPYSKTLLAYLHDLMGLAAHKTMARRTRKGITELFAILPDADHKALVKRGVKVPSKKAAEAMLVECMIGGGKLPLGPAPIEIGPKKLCRMR